MTTTTQHVLTTGKTTTYLNVRSRDCIRQGRTVEGKVRQGHHVAVTPGVSIRLFGLERIGSGAANDAFRAYDRTFTLGAVVEYASYNFAYTGSIVSIGAKTVTVEHDGRKTRLDLHDFSVRNFDLDLEAIARRNADTMQAI